MNMKQEIKDLLREFLVNTKISEVMITPAITIYEDDEFSVAEEKFVNNRIFYLPVVDHSKKLVGFITHKYLYKTQSPRRIQSEDMNYNPKVIIDGDTFYDKDTLDSYILRYIMNKNPTTLKADSTVAEAVHLMSTRHVGAIPIVDDERKIVGVLTKKEIITILNLALE